MRYGTQRLKRRVYEVTGLNEVFNDSNISIILKSSPEKTVENLSYIAEKQGQVVKLNDTNNWRQRHALVVPHTFLYYFGSDSPTELSPHGVIDLEQYTDVKVLDDNVVRLAPGDDTLPIRTFYFRLTDEADAADWARALRESRFDVVRDERNALLDAKEALTEQVVTLNEQLRELRAIVDKARRRETAALSELTRYEANNAQRVEQVQALLAAAAWSPGTSRGGSEDGEDKFVGRGDFVIGSGAGAEAWAPGLGRLPLPTGGGANDGTLPELAALGEAITDRSREVTDLKVANARLRDEVEAAADLRRRDAMTALRLLDEERKRTAKEAAARRSLEAELSSSMRRLEDCQAERAEARANLGVVAAACREAEAKTRELQEHRRVLAREVKTSRAEKRRLSAALACATTAAATAAATVAATAADKAVSGDDSLRHGVVATLPATADGAVEEGDSGRASEGCMNIGYCIKSVDDESGIEEGLKLQDEIVVGCSSSRPADGVADTKCMLGRGNSPVDEVSASTNLPSRAFSPCTETMVVGGDVTTEGCWRRRRADSGLTSSEACSPHICDRKELKVMGQDVQGDLDDGQGTPQWDSTSELGVKSETTRAHVRSSLGAKGDHGFEVAVRNRALDLSPEVHCGAIEDTGSIFVPPSAFPAALNDSRVATIMQSLSSGLIETKRSKRTPLLGTLDFDDNQNDELDGDDDDDDDDGGGITDGTDGDSRHGPEIQNPTCISSLWTEHQRGDGRRECDDGGRHRPIVAPVHSGNAWVAGEDDAVAREKHPNSKNEATVQPQSELSCGLELSNGHLAAKYEPESISATSLEAVDISSDADAVAATTMTLAPSGSGIGEDPEGTKSLELAIIPNVIVSNGNSDRSSSSSAENSTIGGWKVASLASATNIPALSEDSALTSTAIDTVTLDSSCSAPDPANGFRIVMQDVKTMAAGGAYGSTRSLGMGEAAAAAAAAAAERGSRASLEAAAAARRWEAKLKGSFMSMTGGVRWGMCPQKLNGVP